MKQKRRRMRSRAAFLCAVCALVVSAGGKAEAARNAGTEAAGNAGMEAARNAGAEAAWNAGTEAAWNMTADTARNAGADLERQQLEQLIKRFQEYEERFAAIEERSDIEENGYTVIEDQTFPKVLESFGEEECLFLPAFENESRRLAIFLADADGKILFKTNQLETNYCIRGRLEQPVKSIAAVSFQELNGDGLTDIVLITNCENETGSYAGKTYKIGDVLYQKDGGFYRDWRVSDEINRFGMNRAVDMILAYARDGRSTEFLYTATTLKELTDNGFEIFEQQHYRRNFEKMGRLEIVPGVYSIAEYDIFMIYLVNEQGDIVWSFQPMGDYDSLYAMKGMTCKDLDGDGMKDLALLVRFCYTGPDGELCVDVKCLIYYQRTNSFTEDKEFENYYRCTDEDKLMDLVVKIRKFWGWEAEEND